MITVVGKLQDTQQYVGKRGFNVLAKRDDWTLEKNQKFIRDAMNRGDDILFCSWTASGQYREELIQMLKMLVG